jgi:hypothetical protein
MNTQSLLVSTDNFLLEVDHLLLYDPEGVPGVSILQEFGLHCSEQVVRRESQGTVSKIFFFENTYLELLWLEDENAVKQQAAHTGMDILVRTRWQQTGASPFGIGLRCKPSPANLRRRSSRIRWAEWMRLGTPVNFSAENLASVAEPICFAIPHHLALTTWLNRSCERHRQLISHPLGVKQLTGVKIAVNSNEELTNAVSLLERHGVVAIERGPYPLLELTFDGGSRGKVLDARPILPMLLKC